MGMSDISIDIQNMLDEGEYPMAIATNLGIPVAWVYAVLEQTDLEIVEQGTCH